MLPVSQRISHELFDCNADYRYPYRCQDLHLHIVVSRDGSTGYALDIAHILASLVIGCMLESLLFISALFSASQELALMNCLLSTLNQSA